MTIIEKVIKYQKEYYKALIRLEKSIKNHLNQQELLFLQGKETKFKPQLLLEQHCSFWSEDKLVSCKVVYLDFSQYNNKPNIQVIK